MWDKLTVYLERVHAFRPSNTCILHEQRAIKTCVVNFDRSIFFWPECKIFWGFWVKGQQKGYPLPFLSPSESLQPMLTFHMVCFASLG